jgi:GNAT superfamily N-acetyltransferase
MQSTSPDTAHVSVRKVGPADAETFLTLIDALADYEHLDRPDEAARERLLRDGVGERPRYEAFLAFIDDKAVGYAIIYETYSSFLALPTLYLEDIFVLPEARSNKAGIALFLHIANLARTRGCGRMDWTVLDWNTLAQDFYERLGAAWLKDWRLFRLSKDDLDRLPTP